MLGQEETKSVGAGECTWPCVPVQHTGVKLWWQVRPPKPRVRKNLRGFNSAPPLTEGQLKSSHLRSDAQHWNWLRSWRQRKKKHSASRFLQPTWCCHFPEVKTVLGLSSPFWMCFVMSIALSRGWLGSQYSNAASDRPNSWPQSETQWNTSTQMTRDASTSPQISLQTLSLFNFLVEEQILARGFLEMCVCVFQIELYHTRKEKNS